MARIVKQDIWHGDSRVLCDRLKPNSVNCVITDPPFRDGFAEWAIKNGGR